LIAIDTNVLVRLVVADDEAQLAIVRRLIDRAAADGARLHVPTVVLCETVWVLRRVYRFTRPEIAEALSTLLGAPQLLVENAGEATAALAAYAIGAGDFPDYLVRERSIASGAHAVATFDQRLLGDEGFVGPDPGAWPEGLTLREEPPRYGRGRRRISSTTRA
jgi:predicted nucleic-acid-binding protein